MTLLTERINSLDIKDITPHPTSLGYPLTRREIDVIRLLARGKTNRGIAAELNISEHTAATNVRKILSKANLSNRTETAAYAVRHHLAVE